MACWGMLQNPSLPVVAFVNLNILSIGGSNIVFLVHLHVCGPKNNCMLYEKSTLGTSSFFPCGHHFGEFLEHVVLRERIFEPIKLLVSVGDSTPFTYPCLQ